MTRPLSSLVYHLSQTSKVKKIYIVHYCVKYLHFSYKEKKNVLLDLKMIKFYL